MKIGRVILIAAAPIVLGVATFTYVAAKSDDKPVEQSLAQTTEVSEAVEQTPVIQEETVVQASVEQQPTVVEEVTEPTPANPAGYSQEVVEARVRAEALARGYDSALAQRHVLCVHQFINANGGYGNTATVENMLNILEVGRYDENGKHLKYHYIIGGCHGGWIVVN